MTLKTRRGFIFVPFLIAEFSVVWHVFQRETCCSCELHTCVCWLLASAICQPSDIWHSWLKAWPLGRSWEQRVTKEWAAHGYCSPGPRSSRGSREISLISRYTAQPWMSSCIVAVLGAGRPSLQDTETPAAPSYWGFVTRL